MGNKHNLHAGEKHDDHGEAQAAAVEMEQIDFSTFVLSLTGSAMVHLGRVPDPTGEHGEIDLGMARQTIDILTMLRMKTAGNLTPPETALLERVLHDLRMTWIQEAQKRVA